MLAQAGASRSPTLPDVPTMQEAGLRDFQVNSVFAAVGPARDSRRHRRTPQRRARAHGPGRFSAENAPRQRRRAHRSTTGAHDAFIKSEVALA